MSAIAFQIIKFIGVSYLLYLAWSMWKDTGSLKLDEKENKRSAWNIITKGFLINILNPKLSLLFLAFLPQFVPIQSQTPTLNMFILSGIFRGMTFFIFIIYGLFANSRRIYIINSPKIMKKIQQTFSIIFVILGVKLAVVER